MRFGLGVAFKWLGILEASRRGGAGIMNVRRLEIAVC